MPYNRLTSPPQLGWSKIDLGELKKEKIFKNYNSKYNSNPWYAGLSNTFLNSKDFFERSDDKLLHVYSKIRDIGHFQKNFYNLKTKPVFPREPNKCWIDYPNLIETNKTTGTGLRRIGKKHRSSKKLGKMKLEAIPKFKSFTLFDDCPPLPIATLKTEPELPRWIGVRADISPMKQIIDIKNKPIPALVNCWIAIPFTMEFFHQVRNYEVDNYMIFELLKTDKQYVSMGTYANSKYALIHNFRVEKRNCSCEKCQKATKARTIIDATTNWLGYSNKDIGPNKLAEVISVFSGGHRYQEYYTIERDTKAIIAKQISMDTNINIGINGEPVTHTLEDFTLLSEIKLERPFDSNPEYNKAGREIIEVAPVCGTHIPLSWEDQITMEGVKILIGTGKDIQREYEIKQPNTVASEKEAFNNKKYLPKYPTISDRSILEIKDWFYFCKLTRALIRSYPHFSYVVSKEAIKQGDISTPLVVTDAVFNGYREQLLHKT